MNILIFIKNTELKTANELFLNSDIQLKSVEEYWLQENDIDYTELDSDLILKRTQLP